MFAIIGIVVVFGAVVAGFLMEHGHLAMLIQPAEVVTIGGTAIGTLLIAKPIHVIKGMIVGVLGVLGSSTSGKDRYVETLKMMYRLFHKVRKGRLDLDRSGGGEAGRERAVQEVCGLREGSSCTCVPVRHDAHGDYEWRGTFDMDQMMELDMEVQHHESTVPITALTTVADALPGLGIVAAVLGVVITMGALGGPPEEIGKKVAAALVGTFLGILLCYGVVGPLGASMTKGADEHSSYLYFLRVVLRSFVKGDAPMVAIEMGRRAIPAHVRPSFDAMEKACKAPAGGATPAVEKAAK